MKPSGANLQIILNGAPDSFITVEKKLKNNEKA